MVLFGRAHEENLSPESNLRFPSPQHRVDARRVQKCAPMVGRCDMRTSPLDARGETQTNEMNRRENRCCRPRSAPRRLPGAMLPPSVGAVSRRVPSPSAPRGCRSDGAASPAAAPQGFGAAMCPPDGATSVATAPPHRQTVSSRRLPRHWANMDRSTAAAEVEGGR
jgi:hypothetical protein